MYNNINLRKREKTMNQIKYNLFPNGLQHCLTMSFDDGRVDDIHLIEIFNRHNIKGTFHLNSGFLDRDLYVKKEQVKDLYKGHEVSCHTYSHPHLTQLPTIEVIEEVLKDKNTLEELVGYPIRGLSSPFGDYNSSLLEVLKTCGMEYHRTVSRTYKFNKPNDFMEWHPTHHIRTFEKELFDNFLSNPFNEMKILYLWGHSYEFSDNNTWDEIEKVCAYLGNRNNIWYATNIELKDYLTALEKLVISVSKNMFYNPSAIDVWISVNNKAVCIPSNQTMKIEKTSE